MNAHIETKENAVQTCLGILSRLSEISGAEDLLSHESDITELFRNVSFLKILEQHANQEIETSDNQSVIIGEVSNVAKEEESDYTNISKADDFETANETIEHLPSDSVLNHPVDSLETQKEIAASPEIEVSQPADGGLQNIVNEEDNNKIESQAETQKRFRLAQIKNLSKNQPSLFADEFSQENPVQTPVKSNMPLDEMEVPKSRPDFRLDLNDRIAFTQKLFGGSQTDLNNAVQTLNSCKNAEEAKEYLSDLYYEKNWKKVDDYAQRLWMLVENKFL